MGGALSKDNFSVSRTSRTYCQKKTRNSLDATSRYFSAVEKPARSRLLVVKSN